MRQVRLYNGVMMPSIGFGTFQIPVEETERCVSDALEVGYRMIDTAEAYFNEKEVGDAIRHSGLHRDEIFVSTKLWVQNYETDDALRAFDRSMQRLGLDYVDLYMLHKPYGNYYAAWRVLERLYKEGRVKAIGVTSFTDERLQDLCLHNEIKPMVNQIETNPWCQQKTANVFLAKEGIQQEAWSPFAEGKDGIFQNPVLTEIANTHGGTVGQVILRWLNQRGVVVLPKSVHKERMEENIDIFRFSLSDAEMHRIAGLDGNAAPVVNPDDMGVSRFISTHTFKQ